MTNFIPWALPTTTTIPPHHHHKTALLLERWTVVSHNMVQRKSHMCRQGKVWLLEDQGSCLKT